MKEEIKLEKHELYKLIDCLPMPMITDEDLEKEIKEGRKIVLFGKERKAEQVPETFDELIEICIDTFKYISIGETSKTNQKYIIIKGLTFCENGNILNEMGYDIVVNRTPAQMWAIIKNLIGEE